MTLSSFSDVFNIDHERGYDEKIAVGDLVRTGPNLWPHFEVLAVDEVSNEAWIRNITTKKSHVAILSRCRKIDGQLLAVAAE